MNPFQFASRAGYSASDILSFLSGRIPRIRSRIQHARTLGYTDAAILNFLGNQFGNTNVSPSVQKQAERKRKYDTGELSIGRRGYMGPERQNFGPLGVVAGGLAGGFIGGVLGGPAGAVQGAVAGATSLNDIMQSYSRHAAQGGTLGLGDFLRAAAKGVGSAALARSALGLAGMVNQEGPRPDDFIDITGKAERMGPEGLIGFQGDQGQPPVSPGPQGVDPMGGLPVAEAMQAAPSFAIEPSAATQILGGLGILQTVRNLAQSLPVEDIAGALKSPILGVKRFNELEKSLGFPVTELIASSLSEAPQQAPASNIAPQEATQPPKQAAQEPIPQEKPTAPVAKPKQEQLELDLQPAVRAKDLPMIFSPMMKQKDAVIESTRNIFNGVLPNGPIKTPKKERFDHIAPMLSSNIRGMYYDPNSQYLQTVFSDGSVYEYPSVPKEAVQNVLDGNGIAQTIGQSAFRVYHPGRAYSHGNPFSEYIVKAGYEGTKITDPKIIERTIKAIQKADKITKAVDTLDGFAEIMERAKARAETSENAEYIVKALEEAGADLTPQEVEDLAFDVRMVLRFQKREEAKKGNVYNWTHTRMKNAMVAKLRGEPIPEPPKKKEKKEKPPPKPRKKK